MTNVPGSTSNQLSTLQRLRWRAAIWYLIASIGLLALFVYLFDIVLLFFGAILIAVLLRWPTNALRERSGLRDAWCLSLVMAAVVAVIALAAWLVGGSLAQQLDALTDSIPQLLDRVRERANQFSILRPMIEEVPFDSPGMGMLGRGLDVIAATFGAVTNVVLILFMAVLLAAQPQLYVKGSLHLFPTQSRARVHDVLEEAGGTLQRWMVGQLALMTLVGTLTYIGLLLLDVPMPGALALLAGLFTFVPFIGPLFAGAIGVLVGLSEGVDTAIYVAVLYVGVQTIESACEPFVQQKAVYLPPVVLLLAQVVLGVLAGPMGIVLATPLAAVGIVALKRFYVEDVLGDQSLPDASG